jgi:hypothetical protein
MSYARFGDGSDVYVFMASDGQLECCECSLQQQPYGRFRATSTDEMVMHLQAHMAAGEHVPDVVIPALRADDAEDFSRSAEPG